MGAHPSKSGGCTTRRGLVNIVKLRSRSVGTAQGVRRARVGDVKGHTTPPRTKGAEVGLPLVIPRVVILRVIMSDTFYRASAIACAVGGVMQPNPRADQDHGYLPYGVLCRLDHAAVGGRGGLLWGCDPTRRVPACLLSYAARCGKRLLCSCPFGGVKGPAAMSPLRLLPTTFIAHCLRWPHPVH